MKNKVLLLLTLYCTVSGTWAADVNFGDAKVALVEIRTAAWGSWLIITLNDSTGNRIMKFCDTAGDKSAIALSLNDPAAKSVMAIALTAKATGKTVTGWGIDPPQGSWCGIGNFAVYP
ncbi:MAG: hypothetical protein HY273_01955 [Gammaproteobacteria bacterium]|nr:hypothetical protein [Gammaproteobacteria bacterium]